VLIGPSISFDGIALRLAPRNRGILFLGQGMDQQIPTASPTNGASTPRDLFVLTDEQILEIEPEVASHGSVPPVISSEARNPSSSDTADPAAQSQRDSSSPPAPRNDGAAESSRNSTPTTSEPEATEHSPEPPPWLAAQMKDPWSGEQARELWNGVVQARHEAAAYRAAIPTPEDAKALRELYPGGVNEARDAANRAQLLNQIDQAYFGAAGKSAEQTSAARAQLAAMMLREDPAAFREMVFAGLRALEESEKGSASNANASTLPRLAQIFAANRSESAVAPPFRAASSPSSVGAQHAAPQSGAAPANQSPLTGHESHLSDYANFEKAANEDLERSVGTAITRTIEQALPNLNSNREEGNAGARHGVPLRDRLTAAVRQDVESALKGDRQLGEQIAQILSARRFDNETRAQVVRLIDERARQLVPVAAKRVINDWTRSTLTAHRSSAARADATSARREVEPAVAQGASPAAFSSRAAQTRSRAEPHRNALRSDAGRVDYRKLSDEQILDL